MKHTQTFRIAFFMLCMLLISSMLCTPVLASTAWNGPDTDTSSEESPYVNWQITAEGDAITDGVRFWYLCEPFPLGIYHDPDTIYCSANPIAVPFPTDFEGDADEEYYSYVYAVSPGADLIWIVVGDEVYYYATKTKFSDLQSYIKGTSAKFRLQQDDRIASLTEDQVAQLVQQTLTSQAKKITTGVGVLANAPRMEILMRDLSGTCSYVYGTVYYMNSHYYFVDHTQLDNSYFDADGNFSYRSGSISITLLSGDAETVIREAETQLTERVVVTTYENEFLYGVNGEYRKADTVFFWIFLIFFGFLIPLVLLIVSLLLPHSAKRGYPKYWYRLSICAAVWMALAIALTVILIVLQL